MKHSFGRDLPESLHDLQSLLHTLSPYEPRTTCRRCLQPFSPDNTRTSAGWRETQISGLCETCFDNLYRDPT